MSNARWLAFVMHWFFWITVYISLTGPAAMQYTSRS